MNKKQLITKPYFEHIVDEVYITKFGKLADYIYEVEFDRLPEYVLDETEYPAGGCSTWLKGSKMYRSFDYYYDNTAEFIVKTRNFTGMGYLHGLDDGNIDRKKLYQLPYHITDGANKDGIMVSCHLVYNDWIYESPESGEPITKAVSWILSNVHSLDDLSEAVSFLNAAKLPKSLKDAEQTMMFFVSNGSVCKVLAPGDSGYEILNEYTKLTNFKPYTTGSVSRSDSEMQARPNGVERWNIIDENTILADVQFTKCYNESDRLSEFIGINGTTKISTDIELNAIWKEAEAKYLARKRDGQTWQSVHSVVYNGTEIEQLFVQENYSVDIMALKGDSTKNLVNILYPKGSVIVTYDNINPSTYIGGQWVLIGGEDENKNWYPAFAIEGDEAGATIDGTTSTKGHQLTELQIPSHTHSYEKSNTSTENHTLTVAQLPSHNHTGINIRQTGVQYGSGNNHTAYDAYNAGRVDTGYTGSGQGHSHTIKLNSIRTEATGNDGQHSHDIENISVNSIKLFFWRRTDDAVIVFNPTIEIQKNTDLNVVSGLKKKDTPDTPENIIEVMTENSIAKIMAKAFNLEFEATGNSLKEIMDKITCQQLGLTYSATKSVAQLDYDAKFPIGTTLMSSSKPTPPSGVTAEWTQEAGRYICGADSTHLDGSSITTPQIQNIKGEWTPNWRTADSNMKKISGALYTTSASRMAGTQGEQAGGIGVGIDASRQSENEPEASIYTPGLRGADRLRPVTTFKAMWKRTS